MRKSMFLVSILFPLVTSVYAQGFAVTTGSVTDLNSKSVTVSGTVSPSTTVDHAWVSFRYGSSVPLKATDPVTVPSLFAGPQEAQVSTSLSGLEPSTTFCYQMEMSSTFHVVGEPRCFTTLSEGAPYVQVTAAPNVYSFFPAISGAGNLVGQSGRLERVYGDNFTSTSKAVINGVPAVTVNQTVQYIEFVVPANLVAGSLTTFRVDNGDKRSNEVPLVIVPAQTSKFLAR